MPSPSHSSSQPTTAQSTQTGNGAAYKVRQHKTPHGCLYDAGPMFQLFMHEALQEWMFERSAALAIAAFEVGHLLFVGVQEDGSIWVHNRHLGRCLGLAVDQQGLWVAAEQTITRYQNLLYSQDASASSNECNALFAPRCTYVTGALDVHEMACDAQDNLVFVNTAFNCLARPSPLYSFEPLWRPNFITELVAQDRCHLNGLAVDDGELKYVTAIGQTNYLDGWRDSVAGKGAQGAGVLIDVPSNEVVLDNLCMPHSPRLHKQKTYVLNSGCGEVLAVDTARGVAEPIAHCPGYLRGLEVFDDWALIGLSKARQSLKGHSHQGQSFQEQPEPGRGGFSGLPLEAKLANKNQSAQCGIDLLNLKTGAINEGLRIHGLISEIADLKIVQGATRPAMLLNKDPALPRTLNIDAQHFSPVQSS